MLATGASSDGSALAAGAVPFDHGPGRGHRAQRRSRPVTATPGLAWLKATLAIVAIYVLAVASVGLAPDGSKVAVWWPAAGLAVAMLVLAPKRWRWVLVVAVAVSSGLANYTAGRPPSAAIGFGISNAAEAAVVAYWLTRGLAGRPRLRTQEDLSRLLVGTFLGISLVGLGVGLTARLTLSGDFLVAAPSVMASHGAAILVIVPLALVAGAPGSTAHLHEAVLQWTAALATTAYVFSPGQVLGLAFLPMPLLVWAALRLGIRAVSLQLLSLGVMAALMSALGWGPFAVGAGSRVLAPETTAPLVQAFLIASALIVLPLAVAVEQRRVALARVTASEELFRKSFSESLVGMAMLRKGQQGLHVVELNDTAAELLGGTSAELEGQRWDTLVTSAALEEVVEQMVRGELSGWRDEVTLTHDHHRRVSVALSPLSARGPERMFTAQMIDVTETHEAAQRLRTEKDFTSAILNTARCIIVVADVHGVVVGLNPAAQSTTGWGDEELMGRSLWEVLVPPEDRATIEAMFTEPAGLPPTHESALLTRQGDRRQVVWSSAYLRDEADAPTHVVMTGIDVTQERTARRLVSHVLEAATGTSMIGTDLDGTITVFSSGAELMFGLAADDVVNRAAMDLLHDRNEVSARADELGIEPGFGVFVAHLTGDEEPETRDWTCVRADGSRFTLSLTVSAVNDAFGEHIGYLGVGRDVTEQHRSQQLLLETLDKERQAMDRLQELDRAKNDFVSSVSHELRTPITSIVGYTEMLQDGLAGEVTLEQDRLIDAVRRNGERLISLIEDLLTLSRIESGSFTLQRTTLDMRLVVSRAEEALRPLILARRLEVTFDVPDHAVLVRGDADQLERIVLNLMSNAVKFTENGGRVHCTLRGEGSNACIEVGDTGIGIPVAEQGGLFNRFFRSSTAQDRAIQGTGLGLSIVHSIVRSHDGEIAVESDHMAGTTIRVTLPLRSETGAAASYSSAH